MDNDSKVEQFVLLAKNAHGLALVDLINKATSEPGLFTFGELLDLPAVKELQQGEHEAMHSLLRLFAFGTWSDYTANTSSFPSLSEQQQHKLKLLTAVSLANSRRTLPYSELQRRLDLPSLRQLEDLLISDCIYAGLIRGQLDHAAQCLHVEDAFARDVAPEHLPDVIASLATWLSSAQQVLTGIEDQVAEGTSAAAAAEQRKAELAAAVDRERRSMRTAIELQAQHEVSAMALDEGDVFGDEGVRPTAPGARVSKRRR